MARITIEDCIEKVPNRFHLVQMTAIRAKQLKKGANALVDADVNREVVVALREIAAGLVTPDFTPQASAEDSEVVSKVDSSKLDGEIAGLEISVEAGSAVDDGVATPVEPVASITPDADKPEPAKD